MLGVVFFLSPHALLAQPAPPQLNPVTIQIAPDTPPPHKPVKSSQTTPVDELQLAHDRISGLYTRLHLLTPPAQRSALIVELLTDDQEHLRSLGLDLTERALLNAEPTDDTVAIALAALLADNASRIRARAASVLDSMAQPASTPALTNALSRETDPAAAEPLMRAAARRAASSAAPDILRWIEQDSPARPAAIQAIADLLATAYEPDDPTRQRLLEALLPTLDSPSPPARAWETLARLGRTTELTDALHNADTDRATAAAAALLPLPAHTRTITDAALQRPFLAPLAILAIRSHNPTADGYRTIQPFLPQSEAERTESLTQFARAMPPIERAAAAAREQDAARKLLLLDFVQSPDALAVLPDPASVIASRLDVLLETDQPEVVLQSIQTLPEDTDRAPFAPHRVRALIRLSRADEAAAASTNPDLAGVWLEELAATNHPARAAELAAHIRRLFDATLTLAQRAQLDTLSPLPPQDPAQEQ